MKKKPKKNMQKKNVQKKGWKITSILTMSKLDFFQPFVQKKIKQKINAQKKWKTRMYFKNTIDKKDVLSSEKYNANCDRAPYESIY